MGCSFTLSLLADGAGLGTVIIGPPEQKERADEAEARRALEAVMAAADERLKPKEVARRAQEMAPGWSAKELYELLTRA